jgi:hypothetical protein
MNSATPIGQEDAAPAPAPRLLGLRAVLMVLAATEAWIGFSDAPALFGDMTQIGPGIGGGLIKAHLAAHPVLSVVALLLAAFGYVRHAIIALGTIIIMTWLSSMPSVVANGFELKGAFSIMESAARIIAFPLLAACAIAYAAHNEHLGRATLLVAVPTLYTVVLLIGFAISVIKYGF